MLLCVVFGAYMLCFLYSHARSGCATSPIMRTREIFHFLLHLEHWAGAHLCRLRGCACVPRRENCILSAGTVSAFNWGILQSGRESDTTWTERGGGCVESSLQIVAMWSPPFNSKGLVILL